MTTTPTQHEAERLADELVKYERDYVTTDFVADMVLESAEHLRHIPALEAENAELKTRIAELEADLSRAQEAQRCECSSEDACRFARERDQARAELEAQRSRGQMEVLAPERKKIPPRREAERGEAQLGPVSAS